MEVIGGIKSENISIKIEDPNGNGTNIVEIKAEDIIQDEIKQEYEENNKLASLDQQYVEIPPEDIQEIENNNIEKHSTIPEERKYRNKTVPTTTKTVPEKLVLNYQYYDLNEKKKHQQPHKNKNSRKEHNLNKSLKQGSNSSPKTEKTPKIRPIRNNALKILKSEYTFLNNECTLENEKKKYCCIHCQTVVTCKKRIINHIRHFHRDIALFPNITEQLNKMVTKATTRHVAWYEYSIKNGTEYHCSHCQELFEGEKAVETHIIKRHRKGLLWKQCPHCPYKTLYDLHNHILYTHTDAKDVNFFRCYTCGYKQKRKSQLIRHILAMHTDANEIMENLFKCDQCPKMFKTTYGLKKHKRALHNTNRNVVTCVQCPYECKSKQSLKHHIDTHHTNIEDLETLKCFQCAFKTKYKARLQSHIAVRHKQKFQCHICSYQCTDNTRMNLHLIGHQEIKNEKDLKYQCDSCDYKTHRSYSFQVHKLNHLKPEEIQYFYCYHCEFKAKRKDNLKAHILRHFKQENVPFACFICNFTTHKRHLLVRHIDEHSKEASKVEKGIKRKVAQSTEPVKKIRLNTNL